MTSGTSPIAMKTIATTRLAAPPGTNAAKRKAIPSPTNRMGHAQTTSGVPNPRANSSPIATAAMPPKMLSGAKTSTASGHGVSMKYGPPLAHEPPSRITRSEVR